MAKCPNCFTAPAYIGFSSVECVNPKCQHFSQPWLSEVCRAQTKNEGMVPCLSALEIEFTDFLPVCSHIDRLATDWPDYAQRLTAIVEETVADLKLHYMCFCCRITTDTITGKLAKYDRWFIEGGVNFYVELQGTNQGYIENFTQ